jgi:hypothetical protein
MEQQEEPAQNEDQEEVDMKPESKTLRRASCQPSALSAEFVADSSDTDGDIEPDPESQIQKSRLVVEG